MTTPDGGFTPTERTIPTAANTGAVGPLGLERNSDRVIPRKQVVSWAFWDWATQPFNSVILTFVFTALYLVGNSFLPADIAALDAKDPIKEAAVAQLTGGLGLATTIGGLLIAVLAPVLAQRADAAGKRKKWLLIYTAGLIVSMAALFFVEGKPSFFVLGTILISAGLVFSELAGVNYNAMLLQVSTPKTVGRVSGLGWGLGYVGGIVALGIVVVCDTFDWFGMDTSNGLAYRLIAVGCAIWAIVFIIPLILNVPEMTPIATAKPTSFLRSYVDLFHHIARIFRESRPTFWFLVASAVYRDGLSGVFTFGAIIAGSVFGFTTTEVMIFGIAANLVAGVSTILVGRLDDAIGPRNVIIWSLVILLAAGLAVFLLHDAGTIIFWVCGMVLSALVGPVQSASRSLLARVTPAGREGEIFGLYATTGRAASFLASGLWALFILWFGATYWGILGILVVIAAGLVLMLLVKMPHVKA